MALGIHGTGALPYSEVAAYELYEYILATYKPGAWRRPGGLPSWGWVEAYLPAVSRGLAAPRKAVPRGVGCSTLPPDGSPKGGLTLTAQSGVGRWFTRT